MFRKKPKIEPSAMIVGLGNPGPQYARTRHNVGFDAIDLLAEKRKIKVRESGSRALFGLGMINERPVALVKPLTFMNLSGQAVAALAKRWNILPQDILVIADDLDLDPGRTRIRAKGSSGGNRGHKSIIESLGTHDYPRIKIGIGKEGDAKDHVLSRMAPEERQLIDEAINRAVEASEFWLTEGIERTMSRFNGDSPDG